MISPSQLAQGVQRRIHSHVLDPLRDRRLRIDASGVHRPDTLMLEGRNSLHASEYLGTPHGVFSRALDSIEIETKKFVFIDFGCGKGRAVLLAAARLFLRVEGVELSAAMHRAALENVSRSQSAEGIRSPIVLHHTDAIEYRLPTENLLLYLFNPFNENVVKQLLHNVEASLRRHPRELNVIYVNARHRGCFDQASFLQEIPRSTWTKALDRLISPWPIATYRSRSARAANIRTS